MSLKRRDTPAESVGRRSGAGSERRTDGHGLSAVARYEGEFYVAPSGTRFWETTGKYGLKMAHSRAIAVQGAELVIDRSGEACEGHGEQDPGGALEWFSADTVNEAARRGEPICRSGTSIWLYESADGIKLLGVLGTGLIWPPISG